MRLIGSFSVWLGLVLTPSALAQDPTVPVHGGMGGDVNTTLDQAVRSQAEPAQTLPFTGLDLTLVVGAGLVLLALGVMLRKTAGKRYSDSRLEK